MKFSRAHADVHVPTPRLSGQAALARVTHLCVAAHQDDIEIMAHAGICDCLDRPKRQAFGGVVVTNGAGSPRSGKFATMTDAQMRQTRLREQRKAAELGRYSIQIQLGHPSADVKRPGHAGVAADLDLIFGSCRAEVVYLHNPADKHDTHIAVLTRSLEAIRRLPADRRPARVLGCEVWRDLDWLLDADKVPLNSGRRISLAAEMLRTFDSQISGGKRYDLATLGRRSANATFHTPRGTDEYTGITWSVDLTPLIESPQLNLAEFTADLIDRFKNDAVQRVRQFARPSGTS